MNSNQDLIAEISQAFSPEFKEILMAMHKFDRREFIPGIHKGHAYKNEPVPIGDFQTCSQPSTIVHMIKIIDLKRGDVVLEVGTGCGYHAALTYELIRPEGKLITVDRIRKMCAMGQTHLKKYFENDLREGKIRIINEDITHCLDKLKQGSFNKIYFTCSIDKKFDLEPFVKLLKDEGLLLVPTSDDELKLYTKNKKEKPFLLDTIPGFRFVELRHGKD